MSSQFALRGMASQPSDHLFLAIYPDAETATQIAELAIRLRSQHGLRGKPLATDRFHTTLYSLGIFSGVPEVIVRDASMAAEAVAAVTPPFKIEFNRVGSFSGRPGHRPFVLRDSGNVATVTEFHRRLGASLDSHNVRYNHTSRFTPHVTLLYDGREVEEESVGMVSWTAYEFVLVRSLVGKSRHIPLARWALCGNSDSGTEKSLKRKRRTGCSIENCGSTTRVF